MNKFTKYLNESEDEDWDGPASDNPNRDFDGWGNPNDPRDAPVFFNFSEFQPKDLRIVRYEKVKCCNNCKEAKRTYKKVLSCMSEKMAKFAETKIAEEVIANIPTKEDMVCKFYRG